MNSWTPSEDLVLDLRHVLAHAPRTTPDDRFEAWAWRALLDEDGPALLTRDATPSHVTASGIVLSPGLDRTCLVLHHRLKAWVQPGGHLEDGDRTIAAAAAREVLEETGLRVEPYPEPVLLSRHRAPCRPGLVDWHLDVQFAATVPEDSPRTSAESLDAAWFDVDDLPEPRAWGVRENVLRAVRTCQVMRARDVDRRSDQPQPAE